MRDDTSGWPILQDLLGCLRQKITAAQVPVPGFIGMMPGAVAVQDYAANCGGQAWVRLVSTYPSTSFPEPDRGVNEFTGLTAVTVEVGITRCAPAIDEDGTLPTEAEQEEATRVQLADMQVLYLTLACCLSGRAVLGAYTPIGTQDGVVGGVWTATVDADG